MGIQQALGARIREMRKKRKLTQDQLAEQAGVSLQHVGEIERGQGNPTLSSLEKLASALGMSMAEMFDLAESLKSPEEIREKLHGLVDQADEKELMTLYYIAKIVL